MRHSELRLDRLRIVRIVPFQFTMPETRMSERPKVPKTKTRKEQNGELI